MSLLLNEQWRRNLLGSQLSEAASENEIVLGLREIDAAIERTIQRISKKTSPSSAKYDEGEDRKEVKGIDAEQRIVSSLDSLIKDAFPDAAFKGSESRLSFTKSRDQYTNSGIRITSSTAIRRWFKSDGEDYAFAIFVDKDDDEYAVEAKVVNRSNREIFAGKERKIGRLPVKITLRRK